MLCALIGLAMISACYSPTLRNCTVTCETSGDCAGGQICGSDHYCAAPGVADRCSQPDVPDGQSVATDATPADGANAVDARRSVDARPADAAPATVFLHLHDDGHGAITIVGGPTCATSGPTTATA